MIADINSYPRGDRHATIARAALADTPEPDRAQKEFDEGYDGCLVDIEAWPDDAAADTPEEEDAVSADPATEREAAIRAYLTDPVESELLDKGTPVVHVDEARFLLDQLDAARRERDEARALLVAAPAFLGVWNIGGRRSVSEPVLSGFVDAYNAWAADARALASRHATVQEPNP